MLLPNFRNLPLHVYSTFENIQEVKSRPYGITQYQISICLSGNGIFIDENDKSFEISSGDIFCFSPHTKHEYYPIDKKEWHTRYITFGGSSLIDGLFEALGLPSSSFVIKKSHINNSDEISKLFYDILVHFKDHSISDDLINDTYLYKLLYELHLAYNNISRPKPKIYTEIASALSYINNNFDTPLSVERIATETNCSVASVYEIFNSALGTTPGKYIFELRMNMAKQLLCSPEEFTVHEVGIKVGIPKKTYFISCFKKRFGITPGQFKKNAKEYEKTSVFPLSPKYAELGELHKVLPVYITSSVSNQNQTKFDNDNDNDSYQFLMCHSGQGILTDSNGDEYKISPGKLVFIKNQKNISFRSEINPWSTTIIRFRGKQLSSLIGILGFEDFNIIDIEKVTLKGSHLGNYNYTLDYDYFGKFETLSSGAWQCNNEMSLYVSTLLYEFITFTALSMNITKENMTPKEVLAEKASDMIKLYYSSDISNNEIAEGLEISVPTLSKIFKAYYGKTPSEYMLEVRIEQSKRQLIRYSSKLIEDIAKDCGFKSASYFILCFKKCTSMTPGEFRDKYLFM